MSYPRCFQMAIARMHGYTGSKSGVLNSRHWPSDVQDKMSGLSRKMGTLGAEIVEINGLWCSHIYRYRDLT